ncbi:4-hydroxy-3-methylbut-2-enyl diphosphate reductase [candidate division KSB1 bacterium]
MKKINIAKNAGFCFGVKRAVSLALNGAKKHKDIYMLGDIVHNEHVVEKIKNSGIKVVENINQIKKGVLLLQAHGTPPEIYSKAKKRCLKIVDATCPLVLEIHEYAKKLEEEGYKVIIIGDYNHDEVIGIASQLKNSIIVAKPEDINKKIKNIIKKIGVVVQSTQNIENTKKIIAELIPKCRKLKFIDTICGPTKSYQREIRSMPLNNDIMIIVGSFKSANTCRLTEISKSLNTNTYQVESENDIKTKWLQSAETVGITAGASTPDWIINKVIKKIRSLNFN